MRTLTTSVYTDGSIIRRIANYLPVCLLLILVVLTYSNTADDLDFWWHLKHGEFIFTTHRIPATDQFSFTTYTADDIAKELSPADAAQPAQLKKNDFWVKHTIKQGWLAQFLFYIIYRLFGLPGIAVFKACVFALAFMAAYLAMIKRGGNPPVSFLVLALIAIIGLDFNYTRPQIFSFLLFPSMLYLLYDFRSGGRSLYALPAVMVIWANLHGGFILGDIVLIVFAAAETVKYIMHSRFPLVWGPGLQVRDLKKLLAVTLLSVTASLLNPNGYTSFLFPYYLSHSVLGTIEEYISPRLYEYHAYWGMLALVVPSLVVTALKKRLDLSELGVSAVVILGSLTGIRFIPFFALGTAPFLSWALTSLQGRVMESRPVRNILDKQPRLSRTAHLVTSFAICVVLLVIISGDVLAGRVLKAEVREAWYPSAAVDFIKQEGLRGNMFNLYGWGGYLIWTLGPDHKTFVDGRNTNEAAFVHYLSIMSADPGTDPAHPLWKRLLDAYGVDMILVSAVSNAGVIHQLVDRLYPASEWELVYADGKSLVFLRDTADNRRVIRAHRISKDAILDEVIAECEAGIRATPATWGYYEVLGYTLYKKNRLPEALAMFNKYLSMNPGNANVKAIRDILQQYVWPAS